MAMKDWDDVPYASGDCIRDIDEWNKVVEYVKHSGSCNSGAGHILYDNDDSDEQRFKFFYYGDDSILEGNALASKNLTLKANSANDCPYITLFGDSDILNVIENTSDFLVKTCSGTELLKVNDTAITYKGAAIGGGGDMFKATYDTDGNGIVDNSEKLEGSTKVQVQNHNPKAHTHTEVDITDLDHDAQKIKGVTVDNTDIADGKILKYNGTSGNLEYEVAGGGGSCPVEGEVDFTLWTNCAAQTGEKFKFYEHSIDFNADRAIYINDDETYIGHGAGDSITTAYGNTFVGKNTGNSITDGSQNTALGAFAGQLAATGIHNCVYLGFEAGKSNAANDAIAIGYQALLNNTKVDTIGIGYQALMNNTGLNNLALGYRALFTNIIGNDNVAIGSEAASFNNGYYNVAIGKQVLLDLTNGENNVAIGCTAGANTINNMSGCVLIGSCSGYNNTGDDCVLLGKASGYDNATDNRLYINNGTSMFPLIYGEFENDVVKFGDNSAAWNIQFIQSRMHMKETTTPAAIANYGAIYCKADNKLYFQDGAGAEHEIAFI
ncbi:hypothetical protein KAX02_01525 [candidate division WOR-3 bacterium]|nr:hypothetical protein [candidate division WOR-3 bacterium]